MSDRADRPMTDTRSALTGLRARATTACTTSNAPRARTSSSTWCWNWTSARPRSADDVADTVHYGELADALVAIIAGEPVNLIETLADRLADACLADRRVTAATVTVHKPQAPIPHEFADVAVTLRRAARSA